MKLVRLLPLALALLLYLPPPAAPMWFDEIYTANLTTFARGPRALFSLHPEDPHPPLYYLLLWGWAGLAGLRDPGDASGPPPGVEAGVRWPSALAAALAVGAAGWGFGLPAGTLLLASPLWAQKAAEARMYALWGLLLLLAYWALVRGRYRLSAFLGLAALYTHYLALFFLPWQAAAFLLARRGKELWPYLLFLPWVPVFLSTLLAGGNNAPVRPDPISTVAALGELGTYPLGLALLGIPLYAALLRRREPHRVLLLLLPILAVLTWWGASLVVNTASPRYWGAFLPLLAAGVGLGLAELPGRRFLAPLLLAASLPGLALLLQTPREAWVPDEGYTAMRKVAEAALRRQGEALVAGNEPGRLLSFRYYARDPRLQVTDLEADAFRQRVLASEGQYAFALVFLTLERAGIAHYLPALAGLEEEGCRVRAAVAEPPVVLFAVRCSGEKGGASPVP